MFLSIVTGILVASRQQPKVTLELRAARLENAAPVLAQTLGLNSLVVGRTLLNDVILVKCKDVLPQELEDKIAKALNATWEQRPDGWLLAQTPDQIVQDRSVYNSERLKKFTLFVGRIQKRAEKLPEFNEATCKKLQQSIIALTKVERTDDNGELLDKRLSEIDSNNPTERLGLQIARRITPQMFMKLSKDRPKVVYCNRPTAMQIAIPFPVDDLLNQVIREQNLWIKVAGIDPVKVKAKNVGGSDENNYDGSFGSLNNSREPMLKESLSTVTLTLNLSQENVEISAYSTKGEQSISSNVDASDDSNEGPSQRQVISGLIEGEVTTVDEKKSEQTAPKGEMKEFIDLIYQRNMGRNQPSVARQALLKKIIQPEKFDPLTFIAPDLALSQIKNPNVVMILDDPMSGPDGFDLKQMPEEPERKTIVDSSSDWFTCRFLNPIAVREDSVDRKIFGPIVRYLDQNRRELTVEEDATLAFAEQWNLPLNGVFDSLKSLFRTDGRGQFERGFDIEDPGDSGKRIYGSLTDGERRRG